MTPRHFSYLILISFGLFYQKAVTQVPFSTSTGNLILLKGNGAFDPIQTYTTFQVKACRDVFLHIASNETDPINYPIYHVVIGGWSNSKNVLARRVDSYVSVHETLSQELDCLALRSFWASWKNGLIQVGRGLTVGSNVFLSYADVCPFAIKNIQIESYVPATWQIDHIVPTASVVINKKEVVSKFTQKTTCPTFEVIASVHLPSSHACGSMCLSIEKCLRFRYFKHTTICEMTSMTVTSTNVLSYFLV